MSELLRQFTKIWLPPIVVSIGLIATAQYSFPTFHLLAELIAIMIAFMMFAIAWNTYGASRDNLLLAIACGYFWVGVMDLFHAMTFPGMTLFTESSTNLSAKIWLAARFMEGGLLLFVALRSEVLPNGWKIFISFGIFSALFGVLIYSGYFPNSFNEETGLTAFKIYGEYFVIAILISALILFLNHKNSLSKRQLFFIKASIGFTILAEFSFTAYLSAIDGFNLTGHILKVFSYWMIYQALIARTLIHPFKEIELLTKAIMQSPSGMIITDADCNIEFVNPEYERITGYAAHEIVGKTPGFFKAEEPPAAKRAELREYISKGKTWKGVFVNRRKDGTIHRDKTTISSIRGSDNKIQHYLGTMEDITTKEMVRDFILDKDNALAKTLLGSIGAIANLHEARDPYTAGHSQNVSEIAVKIGTGMKLSAQKIEELRLAGLVHDIGKVQVPMDILNKPGRLSAAEFSIIQEHSQTAYEVLNEIPFPWEVPDIVRSHHERCDGSGYPQGLKGEEIPIGARILAVADVLDSVTAHRPYRAALGADAAFNIIAEGRGTLFDAQVVDTAFTLKDTILLKSTA